MKLAFIGQVGVGPESESTPRGRSRSRLRGVEVGVGVGVGVTKKPIDSAALVFTENTASQQQVANVTINLNNTKQEMTVVPSPYAKSEHRCARPHHVAEHVFAAVLCPVSPLSAKMADGRQRAGCHHVTDVITAATPVGENGKL